MRKCRLCRNELPKVSESTIYQKAGFCAVECLVQQIQDKAILRQRREQSANDKSARADHRKARERIKTRSDWLKEAQAAVNAYVRERDSHLPCVSCGRFHDGQYHAGHYRSVGSAPELRFCTLQIWRQCAPCNNHLSGNLINYRIELINRIGPEVLAWVEGPHQPKKYTIEDLKAIKTEYRDKLKNLKSERDAK